MTKLKHDKMAKEVRNLRGSALQGALDRLGLKFANLAALCVAAGLASAKEISTPVTLTQGTDWRGQGLVTLTGAGSINLAGFSLQTDGITGEDNWLEDVTTPDASPEAPKASSSAYFAGPASVLFDNDIRYASDHRFGIAYGDFPGTIAYDFGEPVCLGAYKLYYQSDVPDRFPRTWTFEGSNDGTTWTVVDRHEGDRNWTNPCVRRFTFANAEAFRHYRLNFPVGCTDNGALELYQIECFRASPLDDRTGPDASRVTSTSTFFGGNATMLFDDVFEHRADHRAALYVSNSAPFEVTYDFGAPVCVNRYRLHYSSLSGKADRAPYTWTLAGSNDDKATWTVVDAHTADGNWSFPDVRTFDCSRPGTYRHYRLEVTASVGREIMELYQIEYFASPLITSFPADGTPVTDLTTNDATRASSSELYAGTAANLFDNRFFYDQTSHRICANKFPASFAYDFGEPTLVNGYTIHFNGLYEHRAPKAWTFEGTDDPDGSWNTLDSRVDVTAWTKGEARSFAFANEKKKYRHYRLSVTDVMTPNVERVLELYQLEFGAARGRLHVNVGSGVTQTNRSVVLSGALDLVKEGAGALVAAVPQQWLMGDVRVAEGTLRAGLSGDEAVLGRPGFCTVAVAAPGVFDIDAFGGWKGYPVRLDGGTLACSMPSESAPTETFESIALTADSSLSVRGPLTLGGAAGAGVAGAGVLDLGGHLLTVDLVDGGLLNLALAEIRNGKMAFTVDGAQAANGVKVAAWTMPPALTKARYVHAKPAEDGLYALVLGLRWVLR